MIKSYTSDELVAKLYDNLRARAPEGAEFAYISGYLSGCLKDIAEGGIDKLISIVDYTNQRVEAQGKVA